MTNNFRFDGYMFCKTVKQERNQNCLGNSDQCIEHTCFVLFFRNKVSKFGSG